MTYNQQDKQQYKDYLKAQISKQEALKQSAQSKTDTRKELIANYNLEQLYSDLKNC